MGFVATLEKQAAPIRRAIVKHPFVVGIGDGSLDVERFKHYMRQDYTFLIEYSRVLALASAKAPDLDSMGRFAKLLDETLNTEMELHRGYCAKFDITRKELEATVAGPTTSAYTSFLLSVAHNGSFSELAASLLPCQWGYWDIARNLKRRGMQKQAPLYVQWIEMYTSKEYRDLAAWLRGLVDKLGGEAGPGLRDAMKRAYITSTRYEYLFWDASYKLETWPV